MALSREQVLETLKTVVDPQSGANLVASGMMRGLTVSADMVRFAMEIDPRRTEEMEKLRQEAENKLKQLEGCADAKIVMTAHSDSPTPEAKSEPTPIRPDPGKQKSAGAQKVPGIDRIVAIASGKGGVGKSTISANLACALAAEGRRVGLLDADVYGPSQPRMLGVSGRPSSPDGRIILPMRNHGVTMISIGLMTNEDQAVVWRGPMLMGALEQMMNLVQWGALDILLVDLPPGTGDVPGTEEQIRERTLANGGDTLQPRVRRRLGRSGYDRA